MSTQTPQSYQFHPAPPTLNPSPTSHVPFPRNPYVNAQNAAQISINLIKALSTISVLKVNDGPNTFHQWKMDIATVLSGNPEWCTFVVSSNPFTFVLPPLPSLLAPYNSGLGNAFRNKMDTSARHLLQRHTTGGIVIIHFLDSVFTPAMADWELEEEKQSITSPQQKIVESPLRYFLCLQETQNTLYDLGHNITINLIPFIKGLIVHKHRDRFDNIVLKAEVDKIEQDGIWYVPGVLLSILSTSLAWPPL